MFRKGFRFFVVLISLFLIHQCAFAKNNVIGGYLQIQQVYTIIDYKITLQLHVYETGTPFSLNQVNIIMRRKVDNKEVQSFNLQRNFSEKVLYDQKICIGSVGYNTIYANFEAHVKIYPPYYSDSEGYYLEWTDCCRYDAIGNLQGPELYTTTFRTLFPPIMYSNQPFFDSTPTIDILPKFLLCKQELFKHQILASDPDGDKLKFTLVDPLGFHSISKTPLQWQNGFSATNAISGDPALNIHPETGLLSVDPETTGLFVFAVCVEEFREGRKIGAAVREYLLEVIDCSPTTDIDENIYLNNSPVTNTTICKGNEITLNANTTQDGQCQWMLNGRDIPGATDRAIKVLQKGDYEFKILNPGACEKTFKSKIVHVTVMDATFELEKHGASAACDQPGETILVGPKDLHYNYNWYKNNNLLSDKANSLTISEPGIYYAILDSSTCKLFSDTITVEQQAVSPSVKAEIEPILPICANDDTPITLVGTPAGGVFQGVGVVNNVFHPKQAGIGIHELTYSIFSPSPCPNAVAKQTVEVSDCSKLSIPDAFTPNEDGINDKWELGGIDSYPDAEVTIYNRWGNVIFHSKGYSKPFDGASSQAGVYHYKIKLNEVRPPKTGPLMLIR
ncbi:gliding motility-associated C-terminal domain-containing protein [Dyadobacter sp. CY107]|uniref:gliding motility-associated C-terminal domain-containing protein n=1 Tax=Dyadobacter fanqingshengii TaxID=2906443 RepID=UPI001F377E36|nr:gliding motility-associated C-terminal domain-containing protein [Dyadobacter fanqingshengii]MCF2504382.1 gliding motility-associated C-terminal domain-containing protein [Dyadobacter fanqingshengii]